MMPAGPTWMPSRRGLIAILAVAASLTAVGVIVLVLRGASQPPYVGRQWELARVVHNGEALSLPEGKRASIYYLSNGNFTMYDTVNYTNGKFVPSGSGYTISDSTETLMGYTGTDPRVRVLEAVMHPLGGVGVDHAEVTGGQLLLRVKTDVFTFADVGLVKRN